MIARSALLIVAVAALAGCFRPQGSIFSHTGEAATYYSTDDLPTTVTLVDTRTDEPFFSLEIPVGKQLTLDFDEGGGDDSVETPDLMRYQVFPLGTRMGRLTNALTVPDRYGRRIDVSYRAGPEDAPRRPEEPLRADTDRPAWWTPRGGPAPKDRGKTIYDN